MNNGKPRLPWFVEQMKKHDAEIYRLSADSAETALAEGALDSKTIANRIGPGCIERRSPGVSGSAPGSSGRGARTK